MTREFYKWDTSDSMSEGWEYRIEEKQNDEDNHIINWLETDRVIQIKSPSGEVQTISIIGEESDTPAKINISLEDAHRELYSEEFQNAILSAVGLNTMPVVQWSD